MFAHYITVNYRESYNLFAVSGILFNHESPRRGLEFVTRKVTDGVARIKLGQAKELRLGNLDAHRDWGFAGDYVRAMWLMLQQDEPTTTSSRPARATRCGSSSRSRSATPDSNWQDFVKEDPAFLRPAEVDHLIGDRQRPRRQFGWTPSVDFRRPRQDDGRRRPRASFATSRLRVFRQPRGQQNRFDQAALVGDALPRDVERGAVID